MHLSRQFRVQGYERVCLQLSECNVLGVVGLGPAQLLGEVPGPTTEHGVAEEADRHSPDAGEPVEGDIRWDLAPVHCLVEGRKRLGAHERGRKKLVLGRDLDPFTRQVEDDAAVDDESGHEDVDVTALRYGVLVTGPESAYTPFRPDAAVKISVRWGRPPSPRRSLTQTPWRLPVASGRPPSPKVRLSPSAWEGLPFSACAQHELAANGLGAGLTVGACAAASLQDSRTAQTEIAERSAFGLGSRVELNRGRSDGTTDPSRDSDRAE